MPAATRRASDPRGHDGAEAGATGWHRPRATARTAVIGSRHRIVAHDPRPWRWVTSPSGWRFALREVTDGVRGSNRHDGRMTESNAEPTSAPPPSAAATTRLRRRASDRVAAGVASGLADYLNVDPLLIRVALVGLVLFNGAGFFIYLLAWLFIPVEGRDSSVVEGLGPAGGQPGTAAPSPGSVRHRRTMFLLDAMHRWRTDRRVDDGSADHRIRARAGRDRGRHPARAPDGVVGPPGVNELRPRASRQAWARHRPQIVARRPRERSPLAMYVVGLLLLTIGLMAAIDGTTTASSFRASTPGRPSRSWGSGSSPGPGGDAPDG